jgi:peroxiredoxin
VWAISSTDPVEKLAAYARDKGITYPLLPDAGLLVTRLYGVLNERRGDLAHPTTLVIDREGIVRYKRTDVDYSQRPSPEELLAALRQLER